MSFHSSFISDKMNIILKLQWWGRKFILYLVCETLNFVSSEASIFHPLNDSLRLFAYYSKIPPFTSEKLSSWGLIASTNEKTDNKIRHTLEYFFLFLTIQFIYLNFWL